MANRRKKMQLSVKKYVNQTLHNLDLILTLKKDRLYAVILGIQIPINPQKLFMKYKYYLLTCAWLLIFNAHVIAQSVYSDYSNYIYHFIKYMNWPASYVDGDFIIGVVGVSPIATELQYIAATKKAGNRRIVVKNYNDIKEMGKCQMLFVPASRSAQIKEYAHALKGKPTIIISEAPGMARKGSSINFVTTGGKVQFELNKKNAESSGVRILNELVKLAIPVE